MRHLQAVDPLEAQRRAAAPELGLGALGGKPVEAVERDHDSRFSGGRQMHVGDLDQGILQMGGDDLEVVPVEGDELQLVHDARSLPSDRILHLCGGN